MHSDRNTCTPTDAPFRAGCFGSSEHAWTLLQSRDRSGAVRECEQVLERDENHVGALEVLTHARWAQERFADVVTVTSRLLKLVPTEASYRYVRGMARLALREVDAAFADFSLCAQERDDVSIRMRAIEALASMDAWRCDVDDPEDPEAEIDFSRLAESEMSARGLRVN